MDNFSAAASGRILPGISSGGEHSTNHVFDTAGFIPGFDIVLRFLSKLGLDPSIFMTLSMGITLVTSLLSVFSYAGGSLSTLFNFISANLISSATVHSSDVTYLYIMRFLAANKVSTDCRLFCVTSRKNPQSYAVRRYSSYSPYGDGGRTHDEEDDDDVDADYGAEHDDLGPKLKYGPAPGYLYFWYKGRPVIINRKHDLSYYTGDIPDETMVISTIGRSPAFLREILNDARRDYLQAQSRKTTVYTLAPSPFAQQRNWDQGRARPSRDLSTVIMPAEQKEMLLSDLKEYLNPVTMRWYAQRGLPYRRGYLFFGPPGTGKTSLSLALAGELRLPLYILSLSTGSLTDEMLTMLFVGLPKKCIVLLEDIDCAGVKRNPGGNDNSGFDSWDEDSSSSGSDESDYDDSDSSDTSRSPKTRGTTSGSGGKAAQSSRNDRQGANASSKEDSESSRPSRSSRSRSSISFSGLLNAIDGVASHEGRILIMTTNHRSRLDSALIRPGRIDIQIELGYAGKETVYQIFRELYKELCGKKDSVYISQLAEEFSRIVPPNRFTPAEIQGFLMSYKGKPDRALENIQAWLDAKTKKGSRKSKVRAGSMQRHQRQSTAETSISPTSASALQQTSPPTTPPTVSTTAVDSHTHEEPDPHRQLVIKLLEQYTKDDRKLSTTTLAANLELIQRSLERSQKSRTPPPDHVDNIHACAPSGA